MVTQRKILDPPEHAAGKRRTAKLSQISGVLAGLLVTFAYSFDHAGTDEGTDFADAAYRVARSRTVKGVFRGENVTFANIVPRDLAGLLSLVDPRDRIQAVPDATGNPGAGATENDLRSELYLPFFMPGSKIRNPGQFGLPLDVIRSREEVFEWGLASELVTGETGDAPAFSNEEVEYFADLHANPDTIKSAVMWDFSEYEVAVDATDRRLFLPDIFRPGYEIARVWVVEEADDAADNDIITRLGLYVDGVAVRDKILKGIYQRDNAVDYNLDAVKTGYTVFDFALDGEVGPGQLLPIAGESRPYILADVEKQTGTNKIRVCVSYVRRNG